MDLFLFLEELRGLFLFLEVLRGPVPVTGGEAVQICSCSVLKLD